MIGFIFDLDGTLLDSLGLWLEIDQSYMKQHHIEYKREYSDHIKTLTFDECASYFRNVLGVNRHEEDIKQDWLRMSTYAYAHTLQLKPYALEFVKECAKHGKCIVATSCQKQSALSALKRLGLLEYFQDVVTTQEIQKSKESPDIYYHCASLLELEPKQCYVFEDVVSAAYCAYQAGFHVIGMYDSMWEKDQASMKQFVCRYIQSFAELLEA